MIKRLLTAFFAFLFVGTVLADEVRFVMSAPNAVATGSQFRLTFSVNASGNKLQLPDLSNFEILMGPSTSQSQSFEFVNGKTTQSVSFSYTYILRAKSEGTFTVRPASIEINGKIYESNSIQIQVVKGEPPQQQQQAQPQAGQDDQQLPSAEIDKKDLFVRVVFSKSSVYKGEHLIATIKLYANPNLPLTGFQEVNLPTYEGFYTQDIEIPQQINFQREVYNDKIYQVGILKKTVLFPQQVGRIVVQPFSLTCLVQQRVRPRSFFDDFFNGVRTIPAKITSDAVAVNIKELPAAPPDFYGGVGNFNVSSTISENSVTTNDAVTLKLTITGNGNIRLVQNPKLSLPPDFEAYDPKADDNAKATDGGVSGSKTIEYLFQPRFEGDYIIPPVKFTYFDPASGSYATKSTPEYKLHVVKGAGDQTNVVKSLRKEDVQLLGQDIRFIKQGNVTLKPIGYTFFGSGLFYFAYFISAGIFVALFLVYRKKARENANIALLRNKKANRMARKFLREASIFLKNNKNEAFYEAILKAFWGYLSDKLSIPLAELNRESAVERLRQKNVSEEVISGFIRIIDQCEFARFSPSGGSEAMHSLYTDAENIMSQIEKQIKR
jgi:hypothetical protein